MLCPNRGPFFFGLQANIFYFNKVFQLFDSLDADRDHRLDMDEFGDGIELLGLGLSERDTEREYIIMDKNGKGHVLFDEFSVWYTMKVAPHREIVDSTAQFVARPTKRKPKPTLSKAARQMVRDFDALEAEFVGIATDPARLQQVWDQMNATGGSTLSLMEITTWCYGRYPLLNNKPALMRAYKQTCLKEGGNGDAYIDPQEFPMLIVRDRSTFNIRVGPSAVVVSHLGV